jgi:phosphoribosylformimino-5-aminoimidazole carboxamide ribotide isomerase
MLIIPAIDIKDGRCVRLFQGEMDKETVYFEKPVDAARHWLKAGATFIHIVDLNGAVEGRPIHTKEVEAICRETDLVVELGGGLRSAEAVQAALDLGVSRVVIGTAAYDNQEFLQALCKKFPGKIVVGIDARSGKVAIKGWKETTSMDAVELAQRCEADGASRIIYTDISRDGTREGVNIDETLKIAQSVNIPIIASGGVATLDDIRKLMPLAKKGVEGVIVGRALFTGAFTLREATSIVGKKVSGLEG